MTKEARLHDVGKTVSSTNGARKTEQLLKEKKKKKGYQSFLTSCTKISSKSIKDLNVRWETIKHLNKNIGWMVSDMNCSNIFFDPSPRIMEIKTKQMTLT